MNINIISKCWLNKNLTEKIFNTSYAVIGFIPILWVLSLIVFHYYVSSFFGFNPTYNNPEYSDFFSNALIVNLSSFLLEFWNISMWCCLYFFPIIFLVNLILRFTKKIKLNYKSILIPFFGFLLMCLIWVLPFGETFGWILD